MSEFLEILSPSAKADLEAIMPLVKELADNIKQINNFKASGSPSGADKNIKSITDAYEKQGSILDQTRKKLEMIASLNKQRYQEEAKLIADNDKALTYKSEKELKQIRDKQAMIASLNKQKEQERKETEKTLLANEKLNRAYVQLNAQRELAKNKLQDLIASERASNAEIRKAQKEFDVLNKKVAAADKAVGRFSDANRQINGLSRSVGNLMTAFGVGTGLYLAVDIVKGIYETTKALQSMDLALKMVSGTQQEFAENQAFIAATSEKWGLEIKSATEQYTKFYTASKGILTDTEIKDIFESLAKSGSLLGASAEKQEGTFVALEQMMSKGKVTAEELTKQLGNAMPGALRAMAMAYMELHPQITNIQKAEQALFADMRKGAIDSATYVPLYVKNYEKLVGIEMVDKVETLQAAQNRLKNTWTDLIRSMNESNNSGLAKFLNSTMKMLGNFVDFTKLLFKDEQQLQTYFQNFGRMKGVKEYDEIMNNIKNTSKENIELTKKELLFRERETKRVNLEIVKSEQEKRKSIIGGDRALFHLQTKAEEDALVQIGKSQAIIDELTKKTGIKPKAGGAPPAKTQAQIDAEIEANAKANEKRLKAIEDALKTEYDLKMAQLDQDKIILEQGLENEKLNYSERLNFAYLIAAKELEIADTKYKEEQRLSEGNNDKLKIADINYWKDKEKIAKEAIKRIQDVQFKPQYERQQLADPEKYGEGVGVLGESQTQDMVNLWQKGQDKIKETEEDRIKRLKALRDVLNDVFQEFGQATGFESTMDMFAVIGKNGEDFWTNLTDKKKISEIEWNEWGLAITTVAQDAMNVIDQADEERYQRRLERLEKDKETALKYAGDSAAAKEKIEAQYEKKRKALEVKEFKRKQKMAMANIAIDTAQAIMAVIAKSGQPWMSVVVGALGAVQLAMVASQKPPEYWKGTDNAEAGLAFTQERGAEIILDKHKRVKSFGSDGGAQLTMMEKGDKVKTASETKRIMFDAGLNSILSNNGIKEAKIEIVNKGLTVDEMDMVIGKHFANIQTNHTSFDQRGIQQWSEKNGNRTIRNANRGSGIGFKV